MDLNLTKEQFDAVYNKHLPGKYIKFFYDYFNVVIDKNKKFLTRYLLIVLLTSFAIGFFSTVFNFPKIVIGIPTFILAILLILTVIPNFIARKLNDLRIRRIYKELNISYEEYLYYMDLYYPTTL